MNYENLYFDLCLHAKTVDVKERISRRDKNDVRLVEDKVYQENHHIIPRHAGGTDDKFNLVYLLPEEHYFAHLLRYKAYNEHGDFVACHLMIHKFEGKLNSSNEKHSYFDELAVPIKSKNKLAKSLKLRMVDFRKKHSWHTEETKHKIAESRFGKFNVYDAETGESIGFVESTHENILNGKWVHHSKGMKSVTHKETGERLWIKVSDYDESIHIQNRGDFRAEKNTNFSGITNEQLYKLCYKFCLLFEDLDFIPTYKRIMSFYNDNGVPLPKTFSDYRKKEFGSPTNMMENIANEMGKKVLVYPRGKNKIILNERIDNLDIKDLYVKN